MWLTYRLSDPLCLVAARTGNVREAGDKFLVEVQLPGPKCQRYYWDRDDTEDYWDSTYHEVGRAIYRASGTVTPEPAPREPTARDLIIEHAFRFARSPTVFARDQLIDYAREHFPQGKVRSYATANEYERDPSVVDAVLHFLDKPTHPRFKRLVYEAYRLTNGSMNSTMADNDRSVKMRDPEPRRLESVKADNTIRRKRIRAANRERFEHYITDHKVYADAYALEAMPHDGETTVYPYHKPNLDRVLKTKSEWQRQPRKARTR